MISRAMRDRSPVVRATAAELIAREKKASFLGSLHEMLSDASGLVRGEVIEALGVIEEGSGRHHEDLISRLHDVKPLVRIAAVESLARLQDLRAIPGITSCLQDQDSLVRAYAAIALAELGGSTCLPSISNALAAEGDETAAAGFLVAMRLLGDETKFAALLALLSSSGYRVRCFVANWLPRLKLARKELGAARMAVEEALSHPLGCADASTMSSALERLEGNIDNRGPEGT
ncbi:MAG TPA: HEAT repeat domain-containing protein [Bryobacteraceae bacterium]